MPTAYEIPTRPEPSRQTIALGGTLYQISLAWNGAAACWVMDIADQDGAALVSGRPVVTGVDLLEQVRYLLIGGPEAGMLAQSDNNPAQVPGYSGMGTAGHLYFIG